MGVPWPPGALPLERKGKEKEEGRQEHRVREIIKKVRVALKIKSSQHMLGHLYKAPRPDLRIFMHIINHSFILCA